MSTGPTTLIDLLDEVVASDGSREAFVQRTAEGTQRITFAELAARSAALAQWLVDDRGVRPGDVVGIKLPSGIDYAVAYHAIVRAPIRPTAAPPPRCAIPTVSVVRTSGATIILIRRRKMSERILK